MTNLQQRAVTAALLIPLVAGVVEAAPERVLGAVFAAVVAGASWEWAALCGWRGRPARVLYVLATVAVLGSASLALGDPLLVRLVAGGGLLWWLVALYWVVIFQRRGQPRVAGVSAGDTAHSLLTALYGWLVLVPAWVTLVELHARGPAGPHLVLAFLIIVWCADAAAYFVGRRFGRRRLAPRVSPGKTWEGAAAGVLAAVGVSAVVAASTGLAVSAFASIAAVTAAFSVLGDLTESLFKRAAGVKDSGGLLPGHGGILDRIDSLTAGAPVFSLALSLAAR